MKVSAGLLLTSLVASASAFSVSPASRSASSGAISAARVPVRSSVITRESATAESDESVYEKLGIIKDELAMGVDPDELYEWVWDVSTKGVVFLVCYCSFLLA